MLGGALAVALAVPPARTAILDWLGVGSAWIELVDTLPALEPAPGEVRVVPGRRVSYLWRDADRVRLLITQVPSHLGWEAVALARAMAG